MNNQDLIAEIRRLKQEQKAIVLAHNYQPVDIFEVADFIGDSLDLARRAAATQSRFIVFCGVRFMAETAKLLSPDSRVVLPDPEAGCEMADMISGPALRKKKQTLGDVCVVAYVNTPADVKAESDICCTSANATRVVESIPGDRRILFVPDRNLADYVARMTGREILPWEGFCYVHAFFTGQDIARARKEHPDAVLVSHPECPREILKMSDYVASTGGMLKLAAKHREMVLGTESGMCDRVLRDFPDNQCYPLRRTAICRNMKRTTLEKVRRALAGEIEELVIPDSVADRARIAIERMVAANRPGR